MDCTLGNPPKADPTSLAVLVNARPHSNHLFNKRTLQPEQWGLKKKRERRKAKSNSTSRGGLCDSKGCVWVAKTGTDITTAHHENNEAITPKSEERHSFNNLLLSASFERSKAPWE